MAHGSAQKHRFPVGQNNAFRTLRWHIMVGIVCHLSVIYSTPASPKASKLYTVYTYKEIAIIALYFIVCKTHTFLFVSFYAPSFLLILDPPSFLTKRNEQEDEQEWRGLKRKKNEEEWKGKRTGMKRNKAKSRRIEWKECIPFVSTYRCIHQRKFGWETSELRTFENAKNSVK